MVIPSIKWFFHVWMHLLSEFRHWMCASKILLFYNLLVEKCFEHSGGFIVKSLHFWSESLFEQKLIYFLIYCSVWLFGYIFHWCRNNCIVIIKIDNYNVFVATTGKDWKFSGMVRISSSSLCNGLHRGTNVLSVFVSYLRRWGGWNLAFFFVKCVFVLGWYFDCLFFFHVDLFCFNEFIQVFLYILFVLAYPGDGKTPFGGF